MPKRHLYPRVLMINQMFLLHTINTGWAADNITRINFYIAMFLHVIKPCSTWEIIWLFFHKNSIPQRPHHDCIRQTMVHLDAFQRSHLGLHWRETCGMSHCHTEYVKRCLYAWLYMQRFSVYPLYMRRNSANDNLIRTHALFFNVLLVCLGLDTDSFLKWRVDALVHSSRNKFGW